MHERTLTPAQAQERIRGVFESIESGVLRRTSKARDELEKIERQMERSNRTSAYTAKFVGELMGRVRKRKIHIASPSKYSFVRTMRTPFATSSL